MEPPIQRDAGVETHDFHLPSSFLMDLLSFRDKTFMKYTKSQDLS